VIDNWKFGNQTTFLNSIPVQLIISWKALKFVTKSVTHFCRLRLMESHVLEYRKGHNVSELSHKRA